MPDAKKLIQTLKEYGAHHAAGVAVSDIRFYPELRESCAMNRCGCYDTNWCCPPGCGDVPTLAQRARRFSHAVAFQYIGKLTDSFDVEVMFASNEAFNKIAHKIQDYLQKETPRSLVLGAGKCTLCKTCTYPGAPCRYPQRCIVSVEACGIDVSQLCNAAGLSYITGPNTVTNTGLILY